MPVRMLDIAAGHGRYVLEALEARKKYKVFWLIGSGRLPEDQPAH